MDEDRHYCTDYELCPTCLMCVGGHCICKDFPATAAAVAARDTASGTKRPTED